MEQKSWLATMVARWRLVAIAVVAVAAVAIAVGSFSPVRYEVISRFSVQTDLPELSGLQVGPAAGDQGWATIYAPIKSRDVVQAALDEAGVEVDDLSSFIEDDLVVVADETARTITVSAIVEADEEHAVAFADALLATLEETVTAEFDSDLEQRLDVARAQLDPTWERVRIKPQENELADPVFAGAVAYDATSREISVLEWALAAEKDIIVPLDPVIADKVSPSPLKDGAIGIALGLMAGIGVALVLDARDARTRAA